MDFSNRETFNLLLLAWGTKALLLSFAAVQLSRKVKPWVATIKKQSENIHGASGLSGQSNLFKPAFGQAMLSCVPAIPIALVSLWLLDAAGAPVNFIGPAGMFSVMAILMQAPLVYIQIQESAKVKPRDRREGEES